LILEQWRMLALILLLTASASLVAALQPLPMKLLVDYALGSTPTPSALESSLSALSLESTPLMLVILAGICGIVIFALNALLEAGLVTAWSSAGQRMVYGLGGAIFHRLQRLSLRFHANRSVGDSLSRVTGDAWCVYTLANGLLISPVSQILKLVAVGFIAWRLDPQLAVLSFLAAPVLGGSTLFFGRRLKSRARLGREAQSRIMSFVHQTLTSIPVVQSFGAETHNRRRFEHLAGDVVSLSQRRALLDSSYGMVNGLATTFGAGVVLYVGGLRVLSGTLPLGTLLVFVAYMKTLQEAAEGLLKIYSSLKAVEASTDRIYEILDAEDGVSDMPGGKALPPQISRKGRCVRFENVTFSYEPGRPVLSGITFEALPGETVALVGSTGAGKSTIASLTLRFFDPEQGRVLIDGIDLREIEIASLRAQTAVMLQEPFLMPLSIAENISYGRRDASRAEIVAAAVAANADEFIRALPEGYDTIIGERGATLSGGQRQRIAIARALLKDAPLLILDEPTSALDAQTEASVMDALERLMENRTTLIIAHRLSTIRHADRIVVLERGQVIEQGNHRSLLVARGAYHRFHSLQADEQELQEVVA
jgi:ATP-binding cassette subfamily B protein/subfamily B ATP-binding cassette protein MsbA